MTEPTSPYLAQMERLAKTHGSLPEQQLLARWRRELNALLRPADRQLLNGECTLELGIEDGLTLKVILKTQRLGPVPTLVNLMADSPPLAPWSQFVIRHNLRFHCGIKITPERLTREVYATPPRDPALLRQALGDTPFREAAQALKPVLLGLDDLRGFSMYYDAVDTAWVDALRQELGLKDWQGPAPYAWQQTRYDNGELLPGKTGLEFTPLPAPVLARLASHYPFRHFRYLLPLKDLRNGNFGRDPVSGRFALYATVN